jgi:hypothetical protein
MFLTESQQTPSKAELVEVAHSGGRITFRIRREDDGRLSYQMGVSGDRPNPMSLYALYALPQGIPVCDLQMGGLGQAWSPPPFPGCFSVFLVSDSTGLFGRQCPSCNGYWRTEYGNRICPYCGLQAAANYLLLTEAQQHYVAQYCARFREVLGKEEPGDYVIDMDAVADAVGSASPKPPFYYAEERQQNEFKCDACGAVNDVLGTYAYCSDCGSRNDQQEFARIIKAIRDRINAGGPYESCAKETVAAFDSLTDNYAEQLVARVPLTPERKARMVGPFHNLERVVAAFTEVFGITLTKDLDQDSVAFAKLMFHRRHVYEHKGGEADAKYIADSGDNVRVKQALRETQVSAHRIGSIVTKLSQNLHNGFHEIFPPFEDPIRIHKNKKAQGWA